MNKDERLQTSFKRYQEEHGRLPSGTREVTTWAVDNGLLELPQIDPIDVLAADMSRALRAQTAKDSKGREYRVNQAVRVTKDGTQFVWSHEEFAAPAHSIMSFAQRREGIVSDSHRLKIDVDVHNEKHPLQQYELDLNLTDDVAEREMIEAAA